MQKCDPNISISFLQVIYWLSCAGKRLRAKQKVGEKAKQNIWQFHNAMETKPEFGTYPKGLIPPEYLRPSAGMSRWLHPRNKSEPELDWPSQRQHTSLGEVWPQLDWGDLLPGCLWEQRINPLWKEKTSPRACAMFHIQCQTFIKVLPGIARNRTERKTGNRNTDR